MGIPQINLYYTDWVSENDENALEHDCLHVMASLEEAPVMNRQIISYCMSELPSKFNIEKNGLFPNFTFAELLKQNITSQQLYIWSAPIDVVERYQFFLNNLLTSNNVSMEREIFYNCTLPRFGPMCQYEFDYHYPWHTSLNKIVSDFYRTNEYNQTNLTCYVHLQCNRNSFQGCLDWTGICDGKVDCLDNDFDEEHCWQLEINEYKGKKYFIDIEGHDGCSRNEPSFECEDVRCPRAFWPSSCMYQRQKFLFQSMFSIKDNSISDDCWSAFKCIIPISFSLGSICNNICKNEKCVEIINRTCPYMFYMPVVPVLFGQIYLAYEKSDAKIPLHTGEFQDPYVCYNNSRYDGYFGTTSSKVLFNNATCYRNYPSLTLSSNKHLLNEKYLRNLYDQFWRYNQFLNYHSTLCNRTDMYRCANSSKCISIHHLRNGLVDCPHGDDEILSGLNNILTTGIIDGCLNCHNSEIVIQHGSKNISFQTICDRYTELSPLLIHERNETDETECEEWPCNNIYTRCNGMWNCLNGADEVDCDLQPRLNCSSNHHICVSPYTKQLMCLPLKRANDGTIDCLGATDEPTLCQKENQDKDFYCRVHNSGSCVGIQHLCNEAIDCDHEDDEQFCGEDMYSIGANTCERPSMPRTDVVQFLCQRLQPKYNPLNIYFSLDRKSKSLENLVQNVDNGVLPRLSISPMSLDHQPRCRRGLDLRVWLNNIKSVSTRTCLCPPSYYGDQCQYQNQRISLSIKFQALSGSWQTLFAIVILLIDDSNERIIHSSEQFTYLSVRDCKINFFHNSLLYSTRPKNPRKNYSIHIDIYEKVSLIYRGSLLFPIHFAFLPVHRLTFTVDIPRSDNDDQICSNRPCIHGKCIKYSNSQQGASFCQCEEGWSGQHCTIAHSCMCSSDSLCIGVSANNRSICVCPIYKFGSRCLLIHTVCQNNNILTCQNGGQCIPIDENVISKQTFICMCPKAYTGDRCEKENTKIILSFGKNIVLFESILIHFIEVITNGKPVRVTTYRTISIKQESVIIEWSQPFHLVFIEPVKKNYYLTSVNKIYNQSATIIKTINPSDRCVHISELFNQTFVQLHLLRRIKYYHLPCQNYSLNLSCFYDDIHLCLCYDYGQNRLANCFEFNHTMKFDCLGHSECKNDGECFQDTPDCPQSSTCLCPPCFYGRRCQFNTNGFGLSLDAILGYHILPDISIIHQSSIVQVSVVLTIIFMVAGFINGILGLMTFKNKIIREVGCGLYLFGSSITTLLTMIMFGLKFWMLILAQMSVISNRSLLKIQCISLDYFLRVCLNMDQWLNACVASERAITAIKGTRFDKKKSKKVAKLVIVILLVINISTFISDPIYRHLIVEENEDDDDVQRIWCIITYSPSLQVFNYIMHIFHFFVPFMINLISAIILMTKKYRQQSNLHPNRTHKGLLRKQFQQHKHLFTAPVILVILAIPRLIISFVSKCMKSVNDSWLFLIGYFISFIPPTLTFVIFILPSKFYKQEFHKTFVQYQTNIRRRLHLIS